jgi:hypothetical protein
VGDLAKMAGYPVGVLRRLKDPALRQMICGYERQSDRGNP